MHLTGKDGQRGKRSNRVLKYAGEGYKESCQQRGKTNAGAGNLIVSLLYSFTGIDSYFTRNGRLGLIGHSFQVRDSFSGVKS